MIDDVWHIGRSWPADGHPLEDQCPCRQEPCGLVAADRIHPDCMQHAPYKMLRQGHRASVCPARRQPEEAA